MISRPEGIALDIIDYLDDVFSAVRKAQRAFQAKRSERRQRAALPRNERVGHPKNVRTR